jgi:hypothetical protein
VLGGNHGLPLSNLLAGNLSMVIELPLLDLLFLFVTHGIPLLADIGDDISHAPRRIV